MYAEPASLPPSLPPLLPPSFPPSILLPLSPLPHSPSPSLSFAMRPVSHISPFLSFPRKAPWTSSHHQLVSHPLLLCICFQYIFSSPPILWNMQVTSSSLSLFLSLFPSLSLSSLPPPPPPPSSYILCLFPMQTIRKGILCILSSSLSFSVLVSSLLDSSPIKSIDTFVASPKPFLPTTLHYVTHPHTHKHTHTLYFQSNKGFWELVDKL